MPEPDSTRSIPPGFWFEPFWNNKPFVNEVTEARDMCAAERNYLSMLKVSMALTLAAGSCVLRYAGSTPQDYSLGYVLLILAVIIPFLVLLNYAKFYNGIRRSNRHLHTKKVLLISVALTATITIIINIREIISRE